MSKILVPISPGELVDKLTILRIKSEQIQDPEKLANVQVELDLLQKIADVDLPPSKDLKVLWEELYRINGDLWSIEDDIRAFEKRSDFGPGFIALARAVYVTNDERASIKRQINLLMGSTILEEKSYQPDSPTE